MPRNSNLQNIKDEALAKLNSLHKIIAGKTDFAYRSKLFATEREDVATKLLNEFTFIKQLIPSNTSAPAKKLTKTMITKAKREMPEPQYENTIIRSTTKRVKKEDEPKVLYKFVVKMKNTYVYSNVDKWMKKTLFYFGKHKGYWNDTNIKGERVSTQEEVIYPLGTPLVYVQKDKYNKTKEEISEVYEMTTNGVRVNYSQIAQLFYNSNTLLASASPELAPYDYNKFLGVNGDLGFRDQYSPATPGYGKYVNFSEFKKELGLFYEDKEKADHKEVDSDLTPVFVAPEFQGIIRVNKNLESIQETTSKKLPMKNGVILKNSWLRYAKDISEKAYEITPNICAYTQLSFFLLNPTSGRPTKFIDGVKTSPDAIFKFLVKFYPNLKTEDGITSEMVGKIGEETKRSVYSYDFNENCFFKVVNPAKTNNYCPIVFYRGNGHMYLIDSKEATKSIVERNKSENSSFVSQKEDKTKKEELEVKQSDDFNGIYLDGTECINLQKGYYLLNRHSICYDVINFIKYYREIPRVYCKDNSVVSMKFKNKLGETVVIACDANYSNGGLSYDQLKRVTSENEIEYTNEGVGSVILKILSKKHKEKREYLDDTDRQLLIESFGNKCACCKLSPDIFEIDHIIPLANGGSNEIENFQPLCGDCHKLKSETERELGAYSETKGLEEVSFFNNNVFANVISTDSFKTWQFVERIQENINLERGYDDSSFVFKKIDIFKF